MKILVTGAAGFIGYHVVQRLLKISHQVTGLDNMKFDGDEQLKYARLAETGIYLPGESLSSSKESEGDKELPYGKMFSSISAPNYRFIRLDMEDKEALPALFAAGRFDYVVHLAGASCLRPGVNNPDDCAQNDMLIFINLLKACRKHPVKHLIYASSSSVYGANPKIPFMETDKADKPVSLLAAAKRSNELMAHAYSCLYHIPTTALRYFAVYGPWERSDMAPTCFASAITNRKPIDLPNSGNTTRDFTYIDDAVEATVRIISKIPAENPFFKVVNIGRNQPESLQTMLGILEKKLGETVRKKECLVQPDEIEIERSWAETYTLKIITGYAPQTNLETGMEYFMQWFKSYYQVQASVNSSSQS